MVVLIKQVSDIQDVRDPANPITVSLLPDGTGVIVEEPSLPHFMSHGIDELYEGCESIEMENALITNHSVCVTAIKQTPIRKKKKYKLMFPDNIECKMGYMNPTNGCILRGHVHISKSEIKNKNGQGIKFTHVTIRYMAVVKNVEPKLLRAKDATINNIEELLAGMSTNDTEML